MTLDVKFGTPDKDGWYPFSTAPKNLEELEEVYGPYGTDEFTMSIVLGREARLDGDTSGGYAGTSVVGVLTKDGEWRMVRNPEIFWSDTPSEQFADINPTHWRPMVSPPNNPLQHLFDERNKGNSND